MCVKVGIMSRPFTLSFFIERCRLDFSQAEVGKEISVQTPAPLEESMFSGKKCSSSVYSAIGPSLG